MIAMGTALICILSGVLAGISTGFAGLSAAVFIAPMLIVFAGVDSFSAVGIALASDVLASAASALTYARHGNIDLRRGGVLMITVLLSALLGSAVAYLFTSSLRGESFMGVWLVLATLVLGFRLLLRPGRDSAERRHLPIPDTAVSVICGLYIGFVCGFQGTGGGLMLLFVLHVLLGFGFKSAVGTSVLIMSATALIGAVSHFLIGGAPRADMLLLCMAATLAAAQGAAVIANRMQPRILKRITGGLMVISGLSMVLARLI